MIAREPDDADKTLEIDTWLMSCRVIGRKMEELMFSTLAGAAKERGIRRIRGVYTPTAKNGMVADLYQRLGFQAKGESAGLSNLRIRSGNAVCAGLRLRCGSTPRRGITDAGRRSALPTNCVLCADYSEPQAASLQAIVVGAQRDLLGCAIMKEFGGRSRSVNWAMGLLVTLQGRVVLSRLRSLVIFGTRPEAIKLAPVVHACRAIRKSKRSCASPGNIARCWIKWCDTSICPSMLICI